MNRLVHALLIFAAVAVAACSNLPSDCAALPAGGRYCLQPSNAGTAFSLQQKVDARFGQRRETMIAGIESDTNGMQFIGLTPFGQKFLHVTYDNRAVQAPQLPTDRLPPAMLLAMLQIALWPADAVQRGLGTHYQLEDSSGERRILADGEVVVRVRHDESAAPYRWLHVMIPAIDLELEMQTLTDGSANTQDTKQ